MCVCERARGSKFSLLRGANGGEKGRDAAGDVPFSVPPPPPSKVEEGGSPTGVASAEKEKGEISYWDRTADVLFLAEKWKAGRS